MSNDSNSEPPPWADDAPTIERDEPAGFNHEEDTSWSEYPAGEREWGEDVDEYIYEDARRQPYLKVKRTSRKQFPQYHYVDGKWIKGAPEGPRIPYRLPELLAAPLDADICIPEGEKDCNNVAALGLVATCNPSGAGQWTAELNCWFAGRKGRIFILEDNDDAGRAHAKNVARQLKGIVAPGAEIRIVSFPELPAKGDVSDWLDQGHTKAQLIERCKAAPPFGRILAVRDIGNLTKKPEPRGWLLGNVFCREFVSELLADGGVGKTATRYAQYLSLASGRSLTGEHVFRRCRVLILSFEDGFKELERRLWAVLMYYGIDPKEVAGWLFYEAVSRDAGKIKTIDEKGHLVDGNLAATLEQTIIEYRIDLVGLDPFVKTHNVGENDNDAIDAVVQVLTDLAIKHNLAVDTSHHISKGQADPGNAQKGRGASALVDAGRLVYTLTPMSAEEAKAFSVDPEDRWDYIRMDRGKVNIVRRSRSTKWFQLKSVALGNGNDEYPNGDEVQTVKPWDPPDTWADLDVDIQNRILDTIDAGLGDGRRYSDAPRAKDRAAWQAVTEHAPDKTEAQAREVIITWIKNGVLEKEHYDDPERRTKVTGLYVNPGKRPS